MLLCAALGMVLYELGLFAVTLFLKLTVADRMGAALTTALITLSVVPIAYPVLLAIGKLGGETWKE